MTKYDYSTQVKLACKAVGLPMPEAEFAFAKHLGRRFRADFCWPPERVILEVEGGTWVQGRHSRGEADHEKYNLAASLGYLVFRTVPKKAGDLALFRLIKEACLVKGK